MKTSNYFAVILLIIGSCGFTSLPVSAMEMTKEIRQGDITWEFASKVKYGKFANGDYWVQSPVTIVHIAPEFTGKRNGFEVNPSSTRQQAFDDRIVGFNSSLAPALPLTISTDASVVAVRSASNGKCRPCLESAAVLTVLINPPNKGDEYFRPSYFGKEKKLISTQRIDYSKVPNISWLQFSSFKETANSFSRLQLDHISDWGNRLLHPKKSMPDYGSDISIRNSEALLSIYQYSENPRSDKRSAIINFLQYGLDLVAMMEGGTRWVPNGGHGEGRKLPVAAVAVWLNLPDIAKNEAFHAPLTFGENSAVSTRKADNVAIYAQQHNTEAAYWSRFYKGRGSKTVADPYSYIDGGSRPGGTYQNCCLSNPWKAVVTVLELSPELSSAFDAKLLREYVLRWVNHGVYTQPDPCAPPMGRCKGGPNVGHICTSANSSQVCHEPKEECDFASHSEEFYLQTYGPDQNGNCILDRDSSDGIGRFPDLHGTNADGGFYRSEIVDQIFPKVFNLQ